MKNGVFLTSVGMAPAKRLRDFGHVYLINREIQASWLGHWKRRAKEGWLWGSEEK
jgi:hypothetical protein